MDEDFWSDDPLVRFNAHQEAKGRPVMFVDFRKRWEIEEELRIEQSKLRIRFRGWQLVWRRSDDVISLFPDRGGYAVLVIRRHGKHLEFPRRQARRRQRSQ